MVARLQSVISEEIKKQLKEQEAELKLEGEVAYLVFDSISQKKEYNTLETEKALAPKPTEAAAQAASETTQSYDNSSDYSNDYDYNNDYDYSNDYDYGNDDFDFVLGKANMLLDGTDLTIIVAGEVVITPPYQGSDGKFGVFLVER